MKRALFAISILLSGESIAALSYWEAYDLSKCEYWLFSDDAMRHSNEYKAAKMVMEQRNDDLSFILEGANKSTLKNSMKYGVCTSIAKDLLEFSCIQEVDFPLAGGTYKEIPSKDSLPSYKCSKNCKNMTIKTVHDMGYEDGVLLGNTLAGIDRKKFIKKCGSKKLELW